MNGTSGEARPVQNEQQSRRLSHAMTEAAKAVEDALERLLPKPHGLHGRVHEAMRYATFAGGKLYVFSQDGVATVFKPGKQFEKLAENTLSGPQVATPASMKPEAISM